MQKTIETKGTIFSLLVLLACGGFKDNRNNRDNLFPCLRSLLAEVLKTIETIGTIFFLACKQAQEGETDCPYCL